MSCVVDTGKSLNTATIPIVADLVMNTVNYDFADGKQSIGDLFSETGGNGKLVHFALMQYLQTSAGTMVTDMNLEVHLWEDDTAITSRLGDAFDVTGCYSTSIIDTFEVFATDWVQLDSRHAIATKELNIPVWTEGKEDFLCFTMKNLSTFALASCQVAARFVVEQNKL